MSSRKEGYACKNVSLVGFPESCFTRSVNFGAKGRIKDSLSLAGAATAVGGTAFAEFRHSDAEGGKDGKASDSVERRSCELVCSRQGSAHRSSSSDYWLRPDKTKQEIKACVVLCAELWGKNRMVACRSRLACEGD